LTDPKDGNNEFEAEEAAKRPTTANWSKALDAEEAAKRPTICSSSNSNISVSGGGSSSSSSIVVAQVSPVAQVSLGARGFNEGQERRQLIITREA
jgi:hypothetical protein